MDLIIFALVGLSALCILVCVYLASQLLGLLLFPGDKAAPKRVDRLLVSLAFTLTALLLLTTVPDVLELPPLWFLQ